MPRILLLSCLLLRIIFLPAQTSTFIHVDQFGYWPDAEKVAVLSDPQIGFNAADIYTPANALEVRNALNDEVVMMASPISFNNGELDVTSGDRGWWVDFSDLTTEGSYYLYDATNDERSATFEVVQNPYREVLHAAGRMFYYNRCNAPKSAPYAGENWTDGMNFTNPLQDANCRYIEDATNAALEKELSGGWFDAGDYNKYVTFAEGAIHDLLTAFEENPQAFGDDWNIPESGNNRPDLLDETKWELDWLQKMVNADGSVHIKMGSSNYSDNTSSPPSANTDQRFYGPTCTAASAAVASMFAHAALVFSDIDEAYANLLQSHAIQAFNYVLPRFNAGTLETNCDDGSIVAGDADNNPDGQLRSLLTAAVYLYAFTNDNTYQQFFQDHYQTIAPLSNGYWGGDVLFQQDAYLYYLNLSNADAVIQQNIRGSVENAVNNNWNDFFGWQENDLYRSFMPAWSYHWGSNRPKSYYAALNLSLALQNLGDDPQSLTRKGTEHLHYFHGLNPLGMVMLSNMYDLGSDRCVNEIYHTWFYDQTEYDNALTSAKGPAPGYVTGGPNPGFSVTTLSPPANQPALKSYLEFNDGYPLNSWEITEPSISYQAAYIRLLAHFVDAQGPINSTSTPAAALAVEVFPNPAQNSINIDLPEGSYRLRILDATGKLISQVTYTTGTLLDIKKLPQGSYMLNLQHVGSKQYYQAKLVKQ